jgi:hypothetical protein
VVSVIAGMGREGQVTIVGRLMRGYYKFAASVRRNELADL